MPAGEEMSETRTDRPKVLFVDDEASNLATLQRVFRRDFDMALATSGREALQILERESFDLALVDHAMPEMTGTEFLRHAATLRPLMGRVLLTAYGDLSEVSQANATGLVAAVIRKPWEKETIRQWARHFHELSTMRRALRTMNAMIAVRGNN